MKRRSRKWDRGCLMPDSFRELIDGELCIPIRSVKIIEQTVVFINS